MSDDKKLSVHPDDIWIVWELAVDLAKLRNCNLSDLLAEVAEARALLRAADTTQEPSRS
jgi:hypothetical protein